MTPAEGTTPAPRCHAHALPCAGAIAAAVAIATIAAAIIAAAATKPDFSDSNLGPDSTAVIVVGVVVKVTLITLEVDPNTAFYF